MAAKGKRTDDDNLSVKQFMENTQALMVQKSLAIGRSSNISRKQTAPDLSLLCCPLPKHENENKVLNKVNSLYVSVVI